VSEDKVPFELITDVKLSQNSLGRLCGVYLGLGVIIEMLSLCHRNADLALSMRS